MLNQEQQALAERRLNGLIERLPGWLESFVRWVRQPKLVWLRAILGVLLMIGSVFSILPAFGIWMLPLGIILLAQDIAPLRRLVYRLINWTAERKPKWFGEQPA
jgi:hypothetical protein